MKVELGLADATIEAYTRDVSEFMVFADKQTITIELIEDFIQRLQSSNLIDTTVRRKYMSIRCLCHHLTSIGLLDDNLLSIMNSIRVERRTIDAVESKVVDSLVSFAKNSMPSYGTSNVRRNVAIILTLYHSGLRVSELCSLNLQDINIKKREMRVSGKGCVDRIVPTTEECVKKIQDYVNLERASSRKAMFVKTDGNRLTRRAVSDMLTSSARRAGVQHVTPHMLRRTCATTLMRNGMDLECIQTLLGHEHLATTQSYLTTDFNRLQILHKKCHPFGGKDAI
jgi:integrase/recombinase XerC